MNTHWLAAIYDTVGRLSRGTIIFSVKENLNAELFMFLQALSMTPHQSKFTVTLTRSEDIKNLYNTIKSLLCDHKKLTQLAMHVDKRGHGQKISDDDVIIIMTNIERGETYASIAERYGVSRQAIYYIKNRRALKK